MTLNGFAMTDIDATRLCAGMMGMASTITHEKVVLLSANVVGRPYDPLHDDAQAFALVKRLSLTCIKTREGNWDVQDRGLGCAYPDLNRAIVYCVAQMRRSSNRYPFQKTDE